ncbi:hypothetical protein HAX54_028626, partial [Datura stramonium]|nr:hypothetical protein [Datura stramonium]
MARGFSMWKRMLEAKDAIEQKFWRKPIMGSSNKRLDNWTKLESLHCMLDAYYDLDENAENLSSMMNAEKWNINRLHQILSEDIIEHATGTITICNNRGQWDFSCWLSTSSDKFT